MNFLIVGDPHLMKTSGIRKDDIIETQLNKWKQIFNIAEDNDAVIVVLSDLTDKPDIPYEVINRFTRLKRDLFPNVVLTTAWGNHDEKSDNIELREQTALANLFESKTVIHTDTYKMENVIDNLDYSNDIVEYVKNKRIIKPKILCAHLFYDNAFYGGIKHNITKEMAYDLMEQGVEYIFLGHDHKNYPTKIIEKDGKTCVTHILSGEKYIVALETKLNEEVAEYQADKNLEEMADVLEVLQAICIARGYSLDELEAMRAKKADERGGFKDKVFLEYVE